VLDTVVDVAVLDENEGKYKDTVEGKYAQERLEHLKDKKKREEIAALYDELRRDFGIRALQQLHQNIPGFGKDLPPLQDKK